MTDVREPGRQDFRPAGDFILRSFESGDAASFAAGVRESMATVGRWMSWASATYSEAQALAWFSQCREERERGSSFEFGIFDAETGVFAGGCGLNQFNETNGFCNLGYWVRESWQRKGAALACIKTLSRFGFHELNLGRIEIVVAASNAPSIALAAKAGAFRECLARNRLRVHGVFTDAYVFSLGPATTPKLRLAAIAKELGIPSTLPITRGLRECEETMCLEIAETGTDGTDYLLVPAAAKAWRTLKAAALSDGVLLFIVSAFRSIERQADIIRRKLSEGEGIEDILRVCAPPGFSEHHTGRAIDVSTPGSPSLDAVFDQTAAFAWLVEHANEFGFYLSYPIGNAQGYQYEPWHWCHQSG